MAIHTIIDERNRTYIMDEGGSCITLTVFSTVQVNRYGITGENGIPRAQAMLFLLKNRLIS